MAVLSTFPRLSLCHEIQGGSLWVEFRNLCSALYNGLQASYNLCVIGYIRFALYRWNYQNYPLLQEMTDLFHGNLERSPNLSLRGKGRSLVTWFFTKIPYILESNPHNFYSFRGLKNQMPIRIACGLDSRSRAGFWKNDRAVRAVRTIQYNKLLFYVLFITHTALYSDNS
jgi:hypothetical protein